MIALSHWLKESVRHLYHIVIILLHQNETPKFIIHPQNILALQISSRSPSCKYDSFIPPINSVSFESISSISLYNLI